MYAGRVIVLAAVLGALMLTGCVSDRVSPGRIAGSTLDQARGPDENAKLYTDLIRQLIDQDRLYAALAHLQAREQQFGRTDELRLLRADILRKMGDDAQARALYEQLLDTRFAGQANHGLGLIEAPTDLAQGTVYLQRAVDQVPTNARMRNDLGYALLRQGRLADARLQLATAYQLDENNELNRNNYILLLLFEGQARRAQRIAAKSNVPKDVMDDLRAEARSLSRSSAASGTPPAPASSRDSAVTTAPAPRIGGGGG